MVARRYCRHFRCYPDGRVEFDEPQRAMTPGQAVVVYDGDMVVGSGTITEVLKGAHNGNQHL